jgi:hypothetical protein
LWLTDITDVGTLEFCRSLQRGRFMRVLVKQLIVLRGCPNRGSCGAGC